MSSFPCFTCQLLTNKKRSALGALFSLHLKISKTNKKNMLGWKAIFRIPPLLQTIRRISLTSPAQKEGKKGERKKERKTLWVGFRFFAITNFFTQSKGVKIRYTPVWKAVEYFSLSDSGKYEHSRKKSVWCKAANKGIDHLQADSHASKFILWELVCTWGHVTSWPEKEGSKPPTEWFLQLKNVLKKDLDKLFFQRLL